MSRRLRRAAASALSVLLAATAASCGDSSPSGESSLSPGTSGSPSGITRYVAPNGADTNAGTKQAPWATIGAALEKAAAGETILVADGRYETAIRTERAATADAPITVQAASGARPVIRPTGEDAVIAVGGQAAHLIFDGLTFEGATGESSANIYIAGAASDITFRHCVSRGSARQGFFSERTTARVRIDSCSFANNGGSGPDNQDHNLYVEGTGHRIVNNIITGARNGYGLQLYPATTDVVVSHNTIVGNADGIVLGDEERGSTHDIRITNNIIAFNERTGLSTYWGDGVAGTGNVATANVLFRNWGGNFDPALRGLRRSANVIADPKFTNRAKGDYSLAAGSAADGRALAADAPATDYAGRARASTAPDVGALERVAAAKK